MRKLLQNKTVVTTLALLAMICIAANFVRHPSPAETLVHARTLVPANPVAAADFPVRFKTRAERMLTDWRDEIADVTLSRDPFRALIKASSATTNAPAVFPNFNVQAISIEPGRASAIINRQIVTLGDQISGYTIEEIEAQRVLVSGPAGKLAIRIGTFRPPVSKAPVEK